MAESPTRISPIRSQLKRDADRLDSWKEIASYLRRSVRTARRWEKREGLPVRRHLHQQRGSVYAYRSEIDAWRRSREAGDSAERRAVGEDGRPLPRQIRLLPDPAPTTTVESLTGLAGAATLQAMLRACTDVVCAFDREMRYLLCSLSGARAVDGDLDQMIGRTWRDVGLPDEVMVPVERHVEEVFRTGASVRGEASYPTLSGPSHYEYILDPLRSEDSTEIRAVLAIVREIDQRRH